MKKRRNCDINVKSEPDKWNAGESRTILRR